MRRLPNLVLIGFMATGKTTIGRRCSTVLAYPFRDTDAWIEDREGRSVQEIFAENGEDHFREMEVEAVRSLCKEAPIVLSTGGGVPLNPENVSNLRGNGVIALLTASAHTVLLRTGDGSTRPLLAGTEDPLAHITRLLESRIPTYQAAADFVVDSSNLATEQAARMVLDGYRARAGLPRRTSGDQT